MDTRAKKFFEQASERGHAGAKEELSKINLQAESACRERLSAFDEQSRKMLDILVDGVLPLLYKKSKDYEKREIKQQSDHIKKNTGAIIVALINKAIDNYAAILETLPNQAIQELCVYRRVRRSGNGRPNVSEKNLLNIVVSSPGARKRSRHSDYDFNPFIAAEEVRKYVENEILCETIAWVADTKSI
jgi:hypothetical protein